MLHKVRIGDVLLAKDNPENRAQLYLVSHDEEKGYTLICLSCGERICSYKDDIDSFKKDIKEFWNVINVIPKEKILEFIHNEYHPELPSFCHDTSKYYELNLEIEI